MKRIAYGGPLQRMLAFIVSIAAMVLALMFSAVVLAFLLAAGALAFAYLWWKTRALRKRMEVVRQTIVEEESSRGEIVRGEVIEGEVIRVDEERDER